MQVMIHVVNDTPECTIHGTPDDTIDDTGCNIE